MKDTCGVVPVIDKHLRNARLCRVSAAPQVSYFIAGRKMFPRRIYWINCASREDEICIEQTSAFRGESPRKKSVNNVISEHNNLL